MASNTEPNTQGERLDQIFHAYDIRGIVPSQLDVKTAGILGRAFSTYFKEAYPEAKALLCGMDMRVSGPQLKEAFVSSALEMGIDVLDLGLVSSDLLYFATGHKNLPGVIFTASHNPPEYNGLKACGPKADPVGVESGLQRVKELALKAESLKPANLAGQLQELDMLEDFVEHARAQVAFSELAPLRVAADTANGMGGLVLPAVLEGSNIELNLIHAELDGTFPNHPPDPLNPENQKDLIDLVLSAGSDVGMGFDGDADRVFLVDDKGQTIDGSVLTAMLAACILERHPGETILYNLICSRSVPEIIKARGGKAVRTKVGHTYIKQAMAENGAIFAGEHSGHYFFRSNYGADSGLIAALMVLEMMSQTEEPLSELRKPYQKYFARGEVNIKAPNPKALIEGVAERYSNYEQDRLDGLTVEMPSGWFNLRPSNTEPFVRLNLEAASAEESEAMTRELTGLLGELLAEGS